MSATALTHAAIGREFLGWDRPALPEAARRLRTRYRQGSTLDLGRVIVVVPGQRAGRRLQELLAFLAEDENLRLTPPEVVTEGRLPEMLYIPKQPFANDVVQDLAWTQALRDLPAEKRQHVLPHPPAVTDGLRWLALGKVLRRLHVELAADGRDFAAVHRNGPKLADFIEAERWEALVTLQRRYLDLLDQQKLWDIQTARLKAIEFREIRTDCDIILLGTVDLNNTLRQMLEEIAGRVTAYIVAPDNLADRFDAHGCLVPSTWCTALIPFRDEQLRQVDGPVEQADAVSAWLVQLDGRFRYDEVAIGVPDESLVPQLQRQLEQCGVRARWVEGLRLGQTAPYQLLAAAVKFAGRRRYDDLAALVRHPDLEDWLQSALAKPACTLDADGNVVGMSLPAQLDEFYNAHLPSRISAGQVLQNVQDWPDLVPALEGIEAWLEEASASHPLRAWGDLFRKILGTVYGQRTLDLDTSADEVLHRTMLRILNECDQLGSIPEALDTVPLPAADAFQIALGPLADETLPPPVDSEAVEILGWLELPLDDSRALIITSFNEGFVPKSTGADAFLPDRLRRELGLLDNERRYARDAYATSVLCQSRAELRVLFARRDTQKDPLQPSRLIFACPDDALVGRARQSFGEHKTPAAPRRLLLAPSGAIPDESQLEVPRPVQAGGHRQRVSVTEFKDYLACPYRYYLRHVRKLRAVDDAARELDGGAFGTLLHEALSAFGRDSAGPRDSNREQDIFDFLAERLGTLAERVYGPRQRRPAIHLQLEQARRRLRAFASCQAELRRAGWRIVYVENDQEDRLSVTLTIDDQPIALVGRIDRIDFHEAIGRARILDYKTGDRSRSPEQTHRTGAKWVDLQLPLYRLLWPSAAALPAVGAVELGYFNLPKADNKTAVVLADWDQALLAEADNVAAEVVRALRAEKFWPPTYPAPDFSDDLAAICLDNRYSQPALLDDSEGGAS
ncbi:MAG TPA: PD-(D/E)XK nuclease family protein [Gemmataceae bacterium]|nr:PD-(D/E)XK nuclease family protein [Gemmataceae bacterium]